MSDASRSARAIGSRFQTLIVQILATVIVLSVFGGMALLVFFDRLGTGPLIFFAGLIAGYLAHVIASRL